MRGPRNTSSTLTMALGAEPVLGKYFSTAIDKGTLRNLEERGMLLSVNMFRKEILGELDRLDKNVGQLKMDIAHLKSLVRTGAPKRRGKPKVKRGPNFMYTSLDAEDLDGEAVYVCLLSTK